MIDIVKGAFKKEAPDILSGIRDPLFPETLLEAALVPRCSHQQSKIVIGNRPFPRTVIHHEPL